MNKKKVKKFSILKFLRLIILLIILFIICKYLLSIKTKNIVIVNNNYYTDDQIIYKANIQDYPEFILLNKRKIIKKLKELPLIEEVTISKKKNFVLELNIKEKKVLYLTRSTNEYKLSDNTNVELDKLNGVPTLINFVPEDIEEELVEGLSTIDNNILEEISEIEYSKTDYDDKRFILYMNDKIEVYITLSKIDLLNKYMQMKSQLDDKTGILYLDSGNYFETIETKDK